MRSTMEASLTVEAPAKINIHLRVLEKRADGYHGIESIFQAISLSDRLVIRRSGSDGECRIECPGFDLPADNTVSRSVSLFRKKTGITDGIHIFLEKRIPAGAGLGGGSSDAASTLTALDRFFSTGLSMDDLHDAACRIGSDVPFFLGGSAALVTGRGEMLEQLTGRADMFGVLVWPAVHCGTGEAYTLLDDWYASCPQPTHAMSDVAELSGIYSGPLSGWTRFGNSFTAPVSARYPVIRDALQDLYTSGAFFAQMSGSGSSVFGLFREKEEAKHAFSRLSPRWEWCTEFLLLAHSPMR